MPLQGGVPFGQCFDRFWMNAERYDQRVFAASLQRVRLSGPQEHYRAFCKRVDLVRQVVSHSAVLYPEKFEKIVIMQLFRPCGRKRCTSQVDLRIPLQDILVAQGRCHESSITCVFLRCSIKLTLR